VSTKLSKHEPLCYTTKTLDLAGPTPKVALAKEAFYDGQC
jgi:hypothetical protein